MSVGDELQISIFKFLNKFEYLLKIRADCQRLMNERTEYLLTPIEVEINVTDLGDFDPKLANFVLEKPIEFQDYLKQCVVANIIEQKWLQSNHKVSQLILDIRVGNLLPFPELKATKYTDLSKFNGQRYVKLNGVVIAISTVVNYTHRTNYVCQNINCCNSKVNTLLRIHIPGASEYQTVRNDFCCHLCGDHLEENVKSRMICERIQAEMVPLTIHGRKSDLTAEFRRNQAIVVYFRGSLARTIQLGHRYTVTALTVLNFDNSTQSFQRYLEASHAVHFNSPAATKLAYCLEDAVVVKIRRLTKNFQTLAADCPSFITPLALAYYFADTIVPNGLYIKTKLGIICSLSTCGECTLSKGKMSTLVMGEDFTVINRLMSYAIRLAPSSTTLHSSQQLKIGLRSKVDVWSTGCCIVEGNPLNLANDGICYLGDLNKFTMKKRMDIANCLINECILMDGARQTALPSNLKTLLPLSLPLNCQLWAYSAPSTHFTGKRNKFQDVAENNNAECHKCLIDAFSMVYYPDILAKDDFVADQIAQHTLRSIIDDFLHIPYLNEDDYKTYLTYAQNVKVVFDEKAKELVQTYFVASRRIRQHTTGPSINAIGSLMLLAESFAKLNLRSTVNQNDAMSAILLYEECFSARYGTSCLNVIPAPHWYSGDFNKHLSQAVDDYEHFKHRLEHFIRSGSSFYTDNEEE